MTKLWAYILVAAITVSAGAVNAQHYGTELPFVLGSGARVSGLGVSGVSLSGDASAQYYNPASMTQLQWKEFGFFRTTMLDADAKYHALNYTHPLLSHGAIGLSILRLDVGNVEERDASNTLLSDDLHNSQTRVLLGYARQVTSKLAAGFNLKFDHQSFGTYTGSGFGLDIGASAFQRVKNNRFVNAVRGGLVLQNLIEPSVKLDQESVPDPMQVALGVSAVSAYHNAVLETSLELLSPRFSPFRVQVGQEITYASHFALRYGVDDGTPAFGLGARYKDLALDYAYRSTDIDNHHRLSFAVRFGASVTERRTIARANLEQEVSQKLDSRMALLEQDQIGRSLHQGDSLFALGKYDEALRKFQAVLLWDPDNKHAQKQAANSSYYQLMNQCESAMAKQDYVQGAFHAKLALDARPDGQEAIEALAVCNRHIAESEEFTELVGDLIKTSIDRYAERDYTGALSGFEQALALQADSKLAEEYRLKCVSHIDDIARRHVREAERAAAKGNFEAAIRELEQALTYRPDDPKIRSEMARLAYEREAGRNRPAPVTAAAPAAAASGPRPQVDIEVLGAKYNEGMVAFRGGEFDRAVRLFMDVWTVAPDFHDVTSLLTRAYLFMGMRHYSKDEYASAIDIWKKALTVDPENPKIRRYLNKVSDELKKVDTSSK